MKQNKRSHCPIAFALDIVGDKWSLLVLRDLFFKGKRQYSEFLAAEEEISTNILSDRLARLEREGLITKQRDQTNRRQFIYAPTSKGLDLLPTILELILWSAKHDPDTASPPAVTRRIQVERESFIREVKSQFSKSSKIPDRAV